MGLRVIYIYIYREREKERERERERESFGANLQSAGLRARRGPARARRVLHPLLLKEAGSCFRSGFRLQLSQ